MRAISHLLPLNRFKEALARWKWALSPKDAQSFNNRGIALRQLQRYDEALASFDRAIALQPNFAQAFNSRGNLLHQLNRVDEALASFDRAIALQPGFAGAFNNRGLALKLQERFEEALASYDQAIALQPNFARAFNNRGNALRELNRIDEALASFEQAIALQPDFASAIKNRGMIRLLLGRLRQGFADYEWRWKENGPGRQAEVAAPSWQGEALEGRRIVIRCEQGLGDIMQFVRYLPLLAQRGADVTCLVAPKMVRLLRPLDQRVTFAPSIDGRKTFDFQCALMSLPDRFGTELSSIPDQVPYLRADDELVRKWKDRLGPHGFKVGINWQGSPQRELDRGRAIPVTAFASLARIPGVRLVSLQKSHGAGQVLDAPSGIAVETLADDFDSGPDAFVDTAAVMANLDLIVTSDTSIAHLAGALGRRVWVGLKQVPDWRWLLDRPDSPWYPTMRLFRQPAPGDWSAVLRDMAIELSVIAVKNAGA